MPIARCAACQGEQGPCRALARPGSITALLLSSNGSCSGSSVATITALVRTSASEATISKPPWASTSICAERDTRKAACNMFDVLDYSDAAAELERELQLGLSSICRCLGEGLCMGQPLVFGRLGRLARARLGRFAWALFVHQSQGLERLGTRPELLPARRAIVLQTTMINTLESGISISPYGARKEGSGCCLPALR